MSGPGYGYGGTGRRPMPASALMSISSVAADGWRASLRAAYDPERTEISVNRQGYAASGDPIEFAETVNLAGLAREAYPATHGSVVTYRPDTAVLSDYIYATDSIPNVANHSTEISPKPVAAWVMPSRLLVGASVYWEVVAFHRDARNGRQVACVRVRGNDGTSQTAWQIVAATTISTLCEDRSAVEVFAGDLDVSALAEGLIWLEAEVCPWIGDAASVRRTSDSSAQQAFSPRYFLKDTDRAAAPPIAYVSPSGNDGSGIWSTSAPEAKASPFATWLGAFNAIYAAGFADVTSGKADGCRIRMMAGNHILGSPTAGLKRRLDAAALVIERDPASARSACIVTFGAASFRPNTGIKADGTASSLLSPLTETATLFHDITIVRTGTGQFQQTSSGGIAVDHYYQFWNCTFDNTDRTAIWLATTGTADAHYGVDLMNAAHPCMAGMAQRRLWRGVRADLTSSVNVSGNRIIGCELTRWSGLTLTAPNSGVIFYANRLLNMQRSWILEGAVSGDGVSGIAVVGNLFEYSAALVGGAAQAALVICIDRGNTSGSVLHHNSFTGYANCGRVNLFYSGFTSPYADQTHRLASVKGNIFPQVNLKGDWVNANAAHTGNLPVHHGVGHAGNFEQFHANVTANESESWLNLGAGSVRNTSSVVRNNPMFVEYRGTTGSDGIATAGTGGGDYHLQPGSPAKNILPQSLLSFDIAGTARGTGAQAAGAYA